jgi:hypothetical protein
MSDIDMKLDVSGEDDSDASSRPQESAFQIDIDEDKKKEILTYLTEQLDASIAARADRVKKWIKWRRQREAAAEPAAGEHTMDNASRIQPPLTQIHAQTAYAKVKGYYDTTKKEFWQVKSASTVPQDHDDAKLITKYMGLLAGSPMDLNMEKVKRIVSDEASFMGLLMVKVVWDTLEWKFKSDDNNDGVPETNTMTFHDGPSIIPISQEDTYYPPFWDEVQRMPWVAHELHYPLHELENKIGDGYYSEPMDDRGNPIDPKTWEREDFTESEEAQERIRGFSSRAPKVIDLMEFHFFWDIDDDKMWEDMIWTVHVPTKTVLRMVFNTIAAREFEPFGYMPRSFMLESRGVGQICESLQDEVSGTHRLRNDGMKLATIKMLAMRRSVLRENKNTIYQGKVWITDNPREDMQAIALGEVPQSSLESENMIWTLAAQATGISTVDRGFSDPTLGTRDTFKGQSLRLQQSESISSTIIESTSESWSRVGMLVFFQLVRNAKRVIWNERKLMRLTEDEINNLERILSMNMSDVPRRLKFEIYTTDIEHSYEARRETIMQLMTMTMQAQPQLVQLAMSVFGPQGMQLKAQMPDAWAQLLEIYVGSVNLLAESYKFADFTDTENYLQNVDKWEKLIEIMRAANAQQIAGLNGMQQNQGAMNGGIGGQPTPPAGGGASGSPGNAPGAVAPGPAAVGGATAVPPEVEGTGAGTPQ